MYIFHDKLQPFWGTSIYGNLHISPITLVIDPQTSLNLKLHEGERLLVLFSRIHHGIVNISNEYGRICRFPKMGVPPTHPRFTAFLVESMVTWGSTTFFEPPKNGQLLSANHLGKKI
jgi:hypothetical protein